MSQRFVCIHGHFYQPPRENPWLEAIELQDSAYPYHDWNERITAECYAPNAASRILDGEGRITRIVNNYASISFNFGPTLMAWLAEQSPKTYATILEADRISRRRFSGHGSAMAQAYNHMILPLANRRDKVTQVLWGIRDFEHRFGRTPEGMWLPETAADVESLEVLAELGIQFTVLAPNQARRWRPKGARNWRDAGGSRIDPSCAYEQVLPSGRSIVIFFYDGPISRAVAFERLLDNGERFAERITSAFSGDRDWPQLAHIATDGESYGHHHANGDMALAFALGHFKDRDDVRLTNYGEYLALHPPQRQAEIFDRSSWSCVHGVERWRSNCGCSSGGNAGWNQEWRAPLRAALDWLRDELGPRFEETGRELFRDPWAARDAYISVILDRSPDAVAAFLEAQAVRALDEPETARAVKLMELQRHTMLMYTSCGWFFDELSGIETVQVVQYALRAIQLADDVFGWDGEAEFLSRLEQAKSNIADHRDGRRIYEKFVKPAQVDLEKVGAHYAISFLFEDYGERESVYGFTVDREDFHTIRSGNARLAMGKMRVMSGMTRESAHLSFGVLHLGDHNLSGGVRPYGGEEPYQNLRDEVSTAFSRGDLPEVIRLLDRHFEGLTYSLGDLFRDEQRNILDWILRSTLDQVSATCEQIYGRHHLLMRFLESLGAPQPTVLKAAAESVMNGRLRRALSDEPLEPARILEHLAEARDGGVPVDATGLAYALELRLGQLAQAFRKQPDDRGVLERLTEAASLVEGFPAQPNLRITQDLVYEVMESHLPSRRERADGGEPESRDWLEGLLRLGGILRIRVDG